MKCATSAVHEYLDAHPDVAMSSLKELNFFNGPEQPPHADADAWWVTGQWHRGLDWYADQFDASAPVRGESSPAYTSPDFPEVPDRMASVVPQARLVYLVRDPVDRAASQYAHHVRDGAERRPVAEALLDDASQYVTRSRYADALARFLARFDRDHIRVVVQERLLTRRKEELAALYQHVGVTPVWDDERHDRRVHVGAGHTDLPGDLRRSFQERVTDDVERLRNLLDDDIEEWRTP